jgi:hypothetical protein
VHISLVQWIFIVLTCGCILTQSSILRILHVRKLRSSYPAFFRYNVFCVSASIVALGPFIYFCPQYFYLFWVLNVLIMGLEFFVMYEVLANALKPYSALIDLGKLLFRWAGLFLLVAALLTTFATHGTGHNKIVAAADLLQRCIRLMQCGLLLLFFSFERRLGLSWRSHSMSLALGLGAFATTDLCISYLSANFAAWNSVLGVLGNCIYLAASGFWLYCLANPEPVRKNVLDSPAKLIFQRWNEALEATPFTASGNTAAAQMESFIPSVERAVERVMARKMTR